MTELLDHIAIAEGPLSPIVFTLLPRLNFPPPVERNTRSGWWKPLMDVPMTEFITYLFDTGSSGKLKGNFRRRGKQRENDSISSTPRRCYNFIQDLEEIVTNYKFKNRVWTYVDVVYIIKEVSLLLLISSYPLKH